MSSAAFRRARTQSPLGAPEALVSDVPLGTGRGTLYTRFGDWLAWLGVAIAGVTCILQ